MPRNPQSKKRRWQRWSHSREALEDRALLHHVSQNLQAQTPIAAGPDLARARQLSLAAPHHPLLFEAEPVCLEVEGALSLPGRGCLSRDRRRFTGAPLLLPDDALQLFVLGRPLSTGTLQIQRPKPAG